MRVKVCNSCQTPWHLLGQVSSSYHAGPSYANDLDSRLLWENIKGLDSNSHQIVSLYSPPEAESHTWQFWGQSFRKCPHREWWRTHQALGPLLSTVDPVWNNKIFMLIWLRNWCGSDTRRRELRYRTRKWFLVDTWRWQLSRTPGPPWPRRGGRRGGRPRWGAASQWSWWAHRCRGPPRKLVKKGLFGILKNLKCDFKRTCSVFLSNYRLSFFAQNCRVTFSRSASQLKWQWQVAVGVGDSAFLGRSDFSNQYFPLDNLTIIVTNLYKLHIQASKNNNWMQMVPDQGREYFLPVDYCPEGC